MVKFYDKDTLVSIQVTRLMNMEIGCTCGRVFFPCETCNKIDETEHSVEKIMYDFHKPQHFIKMKNLPKEGDIWKLFQCVDPCFYCVGKKNGVSEQQQYDAHRMYTRLPKDKKEEMRTAVFQHWESGSEILAKYEACIPVIQCVPVEE